MSIYAALTSAISGLRAQSAAIAAVSENIVNVNTTAYKVRNIDFTSLVVGAGTGDVGGGVLFGTGRNVTEQGLIEATGQQTNVAISGQGFFIVSDSPTNQSSAFTYSRNGTFRTDADGYLVNSEGYMLMAQRTDEFGNVVAPNVNDLTSLSPVDTQSVTGLARSTNVVEFDANIPADADISDTFNTSFEIYDNLGVSHTVTMTWTKNASNDWTLDLSDPVLTSDAALPTPTTTGALSPNSFNITFDGTGLLQSIVPATNDAISITGLTTGSDDLTFDLNLGTLGGTDGISQFASNSTDPQVEVTLVDQDGVRFGRLSEIQIDETGLISALFDNGLRQPIYQIVVATFPNPRGLNHIEGTIFDENLNEAGNFVLSRPEAGNAGALTPGAIELSSTDTSEEFNKMIVAQQGYSSAAQIISTADELYDDLIRAVQ